jgi:hypothetical protein
METLTNMTKSNVPVESGLLANLICQKKDQANEGKVSTTTLEAVIHSLPQKDTNDKFFNQWSLLF